METYQFGTYEWDNLRFLVQGGTILCGTPGVPREFLRCELSSNKCPHLVTPKNHPEVSDRRHLLLDRVVPTPEFRVVFWENESLSVPGWFTRMAEAYGPRGVRTSVLPAWGLPPRPAADLGLTNYMPLFIYSVDAKSSPILNQYVEAAYAWKRPLIMAGNRDTVLRGVTHRLACVLTEEDMSFFKERVEHETWEWLNGIEKAPGRELS